jgi:hypothetical protein
VVVAGGGRVGRLPAKAAACFLAELQKMAGSGSLPAA